MLPMGHSNDLEGEGLENCVAVELPYLLEAWHKFVYPGPNSLCACISAGSLIGTHLGRFSHWQQVPQTHMLALRAAIDTFECIEDKVK